MTLIDTALNLPSPPGTANSSNYALDMATFAHLAYLDKGQHKAKPEETLEYQIKQLGFNETEYECLSEKDTQALVAARKNTVVIAFRGTELSKLGDWITDLDGKSIPFYSASLEDWGAVHHGFLNALKNIQERVIECFKDLRIKETQRGSNPQKAEPSIFLTGHSLGGALATLAAVELRRRGYPIQGLYTFGSPRVGNENFARSFDEKFSSCTFRFVNDKDIVTRVAPKWLRYKHVNDPKPCRLGVTELLNQADELEQRFSGLKEIWRKKIWHKDIWADIFNLESITDHDMSAYEKCLKEWLAKSDHLSDVKLQLDRNFNASSHFRN